MSFSVEINDKGVRKALGKLIANFENPEIALGLIGKALENNLRGRFVAEKDPSGRPWAPLSRATLKKRGLRGGILQETGRMFRSVTSYGGRYSVVVHVDHPATAHEYGAYFKNGTAMPRRALFTTDGSKLGGQDKKTILEIVTSLIKVSDGVAF